MTNVHVAHRAPLCLVTLFFLIVSAAWSQVTTATFYGIVTDPAGAIIPGATVTLTQHDTGAVISATTDGSGEFTFDFLKAATYDLRIEAQGFKVRNSPGIVLSASQKFRGTFGMDIGSVSETVSVEAQTTQLNTVSAEQRQTLVRLDITELPVVHRSFDNALSLGTGIQLSSTGGLRLNGIGRSGVKITVDGTDGSSNPENAGTGLKNNFNIIHTLSMEAIEEVETTKGVTPAEYGQQLSGNVNLTTKSGTNTWHAGVFENFRAAALNAQDRFLQTKPGFTFNQFGGSGGGAIKRDRIFIFGAYEGYRMKSFNIRQGDVPTPKLRAEAIQAQPGYKSLFDLIDLPNQPYSATADTARFLGSGSENRYDNTVVLKGDVRVGSGANLAITYNRGRPFFQSPQGRVMKVNDQTFKGWQERGTISYVTGRAHWTSETRFGYNYNDTQRVDGLWNYKSDDIAPQNPGGRLFPTVSVSGLFDAGGSAEFINNYGPVWSLEEKFARPIGAHSLKMGGILTKRKPGRFDIQNVSIGYANKADFLAAAPNSVVNIFGTNRYIGHSTDMGVFIQDDWRVRPNLVLNLGLRYDFFSRFHATPEDAKNPAGLFNPDGLLDSTFHFGPIRDPKTPINSDGWANLGPRIGFSYSPGSGQKTTVRGGFGLMFGPQAWDDYNRAVSVSPDIPFKVTFSKSDAVNLGIRYPAYNDDVRAIVLKTKGVQQIGYAFDPNIQAPYTINMYFGIQRSLSSTTMIESAFVGNKGNKFRLARMFNWPDRVTDVRPNPNLGQGVYYCSCQNTVYTSWQTSVRKRFNKGLSMGVNYTWGKGLSYTGGDSGADFSGDTFNSIQEFFNPRASRGPSSGDTTHTFNSHWVYFLPSPGSSFGRHVFGGWEVSGIFQARSGQPVYIAQTGLYSRPDYISGNTINPNFSDTGVYLNTAAFARVPLGAGGNPIRPGNLGNGAIRGTGYWNLDSSLAKNFKIMEHASLQVRADLFNILNHTGYASFTSSINSANFGKFTSFYPSRQMQLNARLQW
jgi:hypothetical protein